ncbi:hypothetical protein EAF00_006264 [Botryotinia globosa]|nr:hypothetical protein EAF00_006264 [Botryotinia globosa]
MDEDESYMSIEEYINLFYFPSNSNYHHHRHIHSALTSQTNKTHSFHIYFTFKNKSLTTIKMQFSIATLLTCVAIAQGAALPQAAATTSADAQLSTAPNSVIPASTEVHFSGQFDASGSLVAKVDDEPTQALQRRITAGIAVAAVDTIKGVAIVTKVAIDAAGRTISNIKNWDNAREEFTKTTTANMWARNPDYSKYPAVICYNKGYSVKNPAGIAGKVSVKLSLGILHTDYDCMYMTGNNQFYTDSDGGYINLSYRFNSRCSFDGNTGDLSCN